MGGVGSVMQFFLFFWVELDKVITNKVALNKSWVGLDLVNY